MDYLSYHRQSKIAHDIDPANAMMRYVADRFELTIEQRYWLAFLYATCYCGPTVFYMYNEFPDCENVDVPRMERWWKANRSKLLFQTDRLRIKTGDKFVEMYQSYMEWLDGMTQEKRFRRLDTGNDLMNYQIAYRELSQVKHAGRFTLFIWLEMITVLTDYKTEPNVLDFKNAEACARGIKYALGLPDDYADYDRLNKEVMKLRFQLNDSLYAVETTLCAYGKYRENGRRWIGYYRERMQKEIDTMAELAGVHWGVLNDFMKL